MTHTRDTRPRRRAFTVMELLVVITIIVIITLIAIPSFGALMRSSERAMADGLLAGAIRAGRDSALGAGLDGDGAAVFLQEAGGKTTIIPCIRVGQVLDQQITTSGTSTVFRDVFIPDPSGEAVQLPRNWSVLGYAPAYSIDTGGQWYDSGSPVRYTTNGQGAWVLPESGYYDQSVPADNGARQTFMVRFDASAGALAGGELEPAIVVLPRPSTLGRTTNPYRSHDPTKATDLRRFVDGVLADTALSDADKRRLLGDESADTVLARAVSQVALCDVRRLAAGVGAKVDRDTGTIYRPFDPAAGAGVQFVAGVDSVRIREWIEGDTNHDGVNSAPDASNPDEPEGRVFTIDRYTGNLHEVVVQPEESP